MVLLRTQIQETDDLWKATELEDIQMFIIWNTGSHKARMI